MPKIVDHDRKREHILTRCFDLFARRGYSAVTMREIARKVGVSTGTLYHYFPAKNELFQQMFELMSRLDTRRAAEEVGEAADRRERLRRLLRFVSINSKHFRNLLLMAMDYYRRHSEDPAARRFVAETLAYYRRAMRRQLNLVEAGLDRLLFSCLLGMLLQQMLDPDDPDALGQSGFLQLLESVAEPT